MFEVNVPVGGVLICWLHCSYKEPSKQFWNRIKR